MDLFINKTVSDIGGSIEKSPFGTFAWPVAHMLLILYAASLAPRLPPRALQFANNTYFKLFVFSIILMSAQVSPSTALLLAVGFMVTLNYANGLPLWEFIENTSSVPKEDAIVNATSKIENQMQNTLIVDQIKTPSNTIVIEPKIVETSNGTKVINPSVVISPVVVNKDGKDVVVKPDVNILNVLSPDDELPHKPVFESGCYVPSRDVDMTKIKSFTTVDLYADV